MLPCAGIRYFFTYPTGISSGSPLIRHFSRNSRRIYSMDLVIPSQIIFRVPDHEGPTDYHHFHRPGKCVCGDSIVDEVKDREESWI